MSSPRVRRGSTAVAGPMPQGTRCAASSSIRPSPPWGSPPRRTPGWASEDSEAPAAAARAPSSLSANASVSATFDKPPTVTIAAPLNGHAYSASAVPTADFACAPDPGSTLRSCTGTLDDGSAVIPGAALPHGTGLHTLTVTATDADGSAPTTGTAAYTVNPPPACADARATTNEGQRVGITLDCTDPNATPRHRSRSTPLRGMGRSRRRAGACATPRRRALPALTASPITACRPTAPPPPTP